MYIPAIFCPALFTSQNNNKTLISQWLRSPVGDEGPGDAHEQDSVSFGSEGAAVQEEGQVRADHHPEALSQVPVPRVCTVKLGHVVEHVKLQEVPLDKSPLRKREQGFWVFFLKNGSVKIRLLL